MEVSMVKASVNEVQKSTQKVPLSYPSVEDRLEHEVLLLCDPCGLFIYTD